MRMPGLAFGVSCSLLLACGGLVQPDATPADAGGSSTYSATLPADTPFGSWNLVSLDGMSGGSGSTGAFDQLVLDLRSDGVAMARRCTRPSYDADRGAFVCAGPDANACLYGNVLKDSGRWIVDIPDLHLPVVPGRGEILLAARDEIVVRYVLPKYSAGHFVRVPGAGDATGCANP